MSGFSFQVKPQPAKAWEALLTAEYVATHNQDPEHKRQRLRNSMMCFVGHTELDEVRELSLSTADACWEGRKVGELKAFDYERILWELAELNFRFEFQGLDTRLSGTGEVGRQTRIRRCFPGGCLLVVNWRAANHGIASEDVREKAHYLFVMASLMKEWVGVNGNGWIGRVTTQVQWTEDQIEHLETEVASVYTQCYFNSFRRAPIMPLRLSDRSAPPSGWYTPALAPVMETARHVLINEVALRKDTVVESMVCCFVSQVLY